MSTSPGRRPAPDALIAGAAVVALVALVGAIFLSGLGSSLFPPAPATRQAGEIRGLYNIVFAFAAVIFILVEALIVWSVIRYRRRPTDTELPVQTHGNNLLEILWTLIPTAIVIFLFVISWQTLNSVDAVSKTPDVHIRAVAAQFQWSFEYLDDSGTKLFTQTTPTAANGGGMAVPVGRTIQVELQSGDVIHAFYVPRFLFKRDVVPGMTNRFDFTVNEDEAGQTFRGQCAELCGTGHRVMLFDVVAMSQAAYDAWVEGKIAEANATPAPSPSGEPSVTLKLTAKDVTYDTHAFEVAADQPFAIAFTNADPPAIEHDVDIRKSDGTTVVIDQPHTVGGQTQTYLYAGLPAGTYTFICSVHPFPAMTGTLTVR
jgi:cytochrome c oxidase subunit 2